MLRPAALLIATALLAGCRAPMPSFNVLAPYGPTRVPPPATGSYGSSGKYNQPPSQPPAANGFPQGALSPTGSGVIGGGPGTWRPANGSLTSAAQSNPLRLASAEQRVVTQGTDSASELRSRLGGMHVNDATRSGEPALFQPPSQMIEMSTLPPPAHSAAIPAYESNSAMGVSRVVPASAEMQVAGPPVTSRVVSPPRQFQDTDNETTVRSNIASFQDGWRSRHDPR